jgi:hypothetical protein
MSPLLLVLNSNTYQTFPTILVATLCGSEQGAGVKLATSCTRNRPPYERLLPSSACASLSAFFRSFLVKVAGYCARIHRRRLMQTAQAESGEAGAQD